MTGAQMCGWYFGAECSDERDTRHDWSISFYDTEKLSSHLTTPPADNVPKLKVLHITDIHYDPYYQEGSNSDCDFPLCCRASNGRPKSLKTAAGKWGDYRKCDSPLRLIENAFQHIAETHKVSLSWINTNDGVLLFWLFPRTLTIFYGREMFLPTIYGTNRGRKIWRTSGSRLTSWPNTLEASLFYQQSVITKVFPRTGTNNFNEIYILQI